MSVTYAKGFLAAGISAGLKESGRPDLGLLVADGKASAAGAFTTNQFPAAPVTYTKRLVPTDHARAVIVNSGQANVGTGELGMDVTEGTASAVAEALDRSMDTVLVCSTGLVGAAPDLGRLTAAIPALVGALEPDGGGDFAEAILTTDNQPKLATAEAGPYRVGGCAKGAGMISPRLATLLTFITTDAPAPPELLSAIVADRVAPVWNGITVDGCQSTNDTVLLLASGAAGGTLDGAGESRLGDAVEAVAEQLARQLVADAEGATKTIVVQVSGAPAHEDARRVGLAVAGSALVKTAVFGGDPNPGRILQAVGDAGVALDPTSVRALLGGVPVIEGGVVLFAPGAKHALEGPEVVIEVDLGAGGDSATVFGCDLSYDYVRINAEYST